MLRIGINGATGRMGRLVLEEIGRHPDLGVAWTAAMALPHDLTADVVIDFSAPPAFAALMSRASCPVVSGTTGFEPPQNPSVALLHAVNFSLGVAILARLVREVRSTFPDWDLEVVETHHNQKRDAPSGTALRLVDGLGPVAVGRDGPRNPGEIGIHAVRGGDVVGDHRVFAFGCGERLELAHVATNRALFAAGAVRCARWIVGRPPGLYRIEDAL
jgi:4-hydroxy-tetrahydrodipicolinate reductase